LNPACDIAIQYTASPRQSQQRLTNIIEQHTVNINIILSQKGNN